MLLLDRAKDFWHNNVLKQRPPDVDESSSYRKYLDRAYPRNVSDVVECADAESIVSEYGKLKQELADIKKELALSENALKNVIGSHDGIKGPWGKITWKAPKDMTTIDYKAIVEELNVSEDIIRKHTSTKPSSRRLLANIK